jgi:membrane fusion protein, multidrug efflux system
VQTGVSGVSNDGEGAAWTEIVGGPLAVGQQIVKNNLGSLRIGSTVRVVQPAKPALPAQAAPPAAGASGASSPR